MLAVLVVGASRPVHAGVGNGYLRLCRRLLLRSALTEAVTLASSGLSARWVTEPEELTSVSATLVDAFAADPLFVWMAPNLELRRDLIETLVRHAFLNGGVLTTLNGGVLTTSPVGQGAALWFESDRASAGPLSIVLSGQAFLIPRFGLRHTAKLLTLDAFPIRTRTRLLREAGVQGPAIYLYRVGVREEFRRQGMASRLIRPLLEYADATGQHVLLETHKPANVPLYEPLGFEVRHRETVPADAPTTTSMVRVPALARLRPARSGRIGACQANASWSWEPWPS
jgi:GNAT superfamily N-acetyltransferase